MCFLLCMQFLKVKQCTQNRNVKMASEELALSLLMLQAKPRLVNGNSFSFNVFMKPRNVNTLLICARKIQ